MGRATAAKLAAVALLVLSASIAAAVGLPGLSTGQGGPSGAQPTTERRPAGSFQSTTAPVETVVVAYDTERSHGVAVPVTVRPIDASGLYVDVANTTHIASLQTSLRRASQVADDETGYTGGYRFGFETPDHWEYVGGQSAGVMFTLAMIATDPDYRLADDVAATGEVTTQGTVGNVRHVRRKAIAAREHGIEVFLVPHGQSVSVDGIRVVEVRNVSEAMEHAVVD